MGKIIIISGPSGSGQDTVIEELKKRMPVERIVTTTTRQPRAGESEGHPYYFVTKEDFLQGVDRGDFVEFAKEYNGQYYGVTKEELKRVNELDCLVVWKVEYKGVISAKKIFPDIKAILLFASLDVLEKRIRMRDNATDEYVHERMAYTKEVLEHRNVYDYEVENIEGKLTETVDRVEAIIKKIF